MSTGLDESSTLALGEINKYDFRTDSPAVFKARRGIDAEIVVADLGDEARAGVDARLPAEVAGDLRLQADADVGRRHRHRFPGHLLLPQARRAAGQDLGRRARRHQEDLRPARHPRGGAEVSRRREGPVRERGGLRLAPGGPRQEGRDLHRHRHRRPRAPRPAPRVLRHDHPADRQQVRRPQLGGLVGRLVHLRAQGGEDRVPAPGLLPHQRREHGAVRADADHRRRGGAGALRRGLHGPDVFDREPALGRRRDRRQEARPLPLHDDPELGQQHLQPRHQAGHGLRGGD